MPHILARELSFAIKDKKHPSLDPIVTTLDERGLHLGATIGGALLLNDETAPYAGIGMAAPYIPGLVREYQVNKKALDLLKEVKEVEVVGISKGKGFQGVMKRHNFHGGPASHGSLQHREPGSIGARAKPGRVAKGKKLPGHMGLDTVTKRNIKVSYIDPEKNLIGLKGPVPGPIGSLVIIRK